MAAWWIGIVLVLVSLVVLAVRRRAGAGGTIKHDLVEGALPSALTGSSTRSRERDGWELRWADVADVAPAETDRPGADASEERPTEDPVARSVS